MHSELISCNGSVICANCFSFKSSLRHKPYKTLYDVTVQSIKLYIYGHCPIQCKGNYESLGVENTV